ncbi:MAG: IclR family transcriptional regulator C-terminal domain-containing protein [Fusobacterium sp. JB019]|nr:IclR family transcriptional regulator C-terminal domain-containing protein [Fusobacterium sp. JB019]
MKKEIKIIQSIQRAVNILNCFDEKNMELSLKEISDKIELNINTTRGIINTLVLNELVCHNNKKNTYSIGNFFMLKSNLLQKNNVNRARDLSVDLLTNLSEKFKVSSRLQIIEADNIFTAKTINPKLSHYILTSTQSLNFPLHATASGKILLKYRKKNLEDLNLESFTENTIIEKSILKKELKLIEKNGYATEFDEIGFGISSIAVPIFDNNNSIFGSVSVTAITPIIKKLKDEIIEDLKNLADVLENRIFLKEK